MKHKLLHLIITLRKQESKTKTRGYLQVTTIFPDPVSSSVLSQLLLSSDIASHNTNSLKTFCSLLP